MQRQMEVLYQQEVPEEDQRILLQDTPSCHPKYVIVLSKFTDFCINLRDEDLCHNAS